MDEHDHAVSNESMVEEDRSGRRRTPSSRNSTEHGGRVGLLPPPSTLRLELVADRTAISEDALQELDQSGGREDEIILYTSLLSLSSASSQALHPQWYHLDEKVALLEHTRQRLDATCGTVMDAAAWESIYKILRARVVMQISEGCTSIDDLDRRGERAKSTVAASTVFVLAELPLYPTALRRLPRPSRGRRKSSDIGIDEDGSGAFFDDQNSPRSSISDDALANIVIPSALPPNTFLVHYSDGKTRIDPDLYQRLVKARIVSEVRSSMLGRARIDSGVLEDQIREDQKARRFDDDVFDMLGENDADGGDTPERPSSQQVIGPLKVNASESNELARGNSTPFKDDEFDLLSGGGAGHEAPHLAVSSSTQNDEPTNAHGKIPSKKSEPFPSTECLSANKDNFHPVLPTSDEVEIGDLKSEVAELRTLLASEEHCLEEEQSKLVKKVNGLRILAQETKHIKVEIEMMNQDAFQQEHLLNEALIFLEVRRAKALRDLRQIYPIQCLPDNVYTIGGLHLPSDLNNPNVPDAAVSTALGYVCHLVYMCSKYLCAPLRYRLFCNSSRSAVQDDGVAVYPLFRERVVEREQFDRACTLLSRNVECLLRGRCIVVPNNRSHILDKVNRLFEESDAD